MTKQGAALVTGAGKRIGRAIALHLASQGLDVAFHYASSRDEAEEAASEALALGVKAIAVGADLLDPAETDQLVPAAAKGLGQPLSVLVNNASIFEYDNMSTATAESWRRHMVSNLRAPFFLSQAFVAQAPAAGTDEFGEAVANAMIVNMVDMRVRKLTPEFMTYTIAKSALWTFTQTAAQAMAPSVRVNAIGPGPTMKGHRQSEDHFRTQRSRTVLERGSNPEDIVSAVDFLLRNKAVTGQLICVDGGQHLAWKTPDVLGVE